jgi:hypothetical protein
VVAQGFSPVIRKLTKCEVGGVVMASRAKPASANQLDGAGNRIFRLMTAPRKRAPLRLTSPHPHASDAVAGDGVRRAARDGSPKQPRPASPRRYPTTFH